MHHPRMRAKPLAASLLVAAISACSAAGAPSPTPEPTVRPTSTPIVTRVSSPADAAALVIDTNPIFAGTMELRPDVIGLSRWWTATPLVTGGYRVELTVGWGDCMAGCIERHIWTFEVDASGGVTLVSETGDPVPSDLPA
jgi:hypothetical protein